MSSAPRELRNRYLDYLEQGLDGDTAVELAYEDALRAQLEELIARQPAHNAPIAVDEPPTTGGSDGSDGCD